MICPFGLDIWKNCLRDHQIKVDFLQINLVVILQPGEFYIGFVQVNLI